MAQTQIDLDSQSKDSTLVPSKVTTNTSDNFIFPGNVTSGAGSVDASAILQGNSTTKGFLPPRMDTTQRDAISSPATGLMIYNTTTSSFEFWNGSAWVSVGSSTSFITDVFSYSGTNVFTLSDTPVTNSEVITRNGLVLEAGSGNDYTLSGTTLTILDTLISGDLIQAKYPISMSGGSGASTSFQLLPTDPGSPSTGDIWFNTTDFQFKGYNGTSIVLLG